MVHNFNLNIPHGAIMQIAHRIAGDDDRIDYQEFVAALHEKDSSNPEWFLKGRTEGVAHELNTGHKGKTQSHSTRSARTPVRSVRGAHR